MQSEIPSESFIWGVLSARFQSELTLQKSEIWRLSGLLDEYGGVADDDLYREREQMHLLKRSPGFWCKRSRTRRQAASLPVTPAAVPVVPRTL